MLKVFVSLAAVCCCSAASQKSGQMGMTELVQMREDLRARLDSGVRINDSERSTWIMFQNLIENTSIAYILEEFRAEGEALNESWDKVVECHTNLTTDHTTWGTQKTDKDTKEGEHDTCRTNQPDDNCNETCTNCRTYLENLLSSPPPSGSIESSPGVHRVPVFNDCDDSSCWGNYGNDEENATLSAWFKKYHDFHCEVDTDCPDGANGAVVSKKPYACWQHCTTACANEISNYGDNETACETDQNEFETAACLFITTVTDDVDTYENCRSGPNGNDGKDAAYNTKKGLIETLEERLVVEYQIMKTIVCYITLILKPNDQAITESERTACEQYYPMEIPTLAIYYPSNYAPFNGANGWEEVNAQCLNFPNAASCPCNDGTDPGFCGFDETSPSMTDCAAFEAEYYTGKAWYNSNGGCGSDQDAVTSIACDASRAVDAGCS